MANENNTRKEIEHVSDFIDSVSNIISNHNDPNFHFVYRGECLKYDKYCSPSIFRKNVLSTNPLYEKSLFNTMRQNKLSNNTSYLENAIDAQHGEFPSRLLDVTYNCLVALYFAVTPYYHSKSNKYDDDDGMVYVFYVDEIFSPSAQNTNENYDAIINKNFSWFNDHAIFEKNHKFIDHTKINNRIIAQQGAFILFQGNDDESIPSYMISGIVIPGKAKSNIRKELSLMFGINTGSIYPEIVNVAEDLVNKSKSLVTEPFCWENEIKYVLNNLKKELSYYTKYLFNIKSNRNMDYYKVVQAVESLINSYRVGLIDFLNHFKDYNFEDQEKKYPDTINSIINRYNAIITEAAEDLLVRCETSISEGLTIKTI
ncbi:MAG: FRG domain-containing protein [Clostridia bacterium]|nr:FRG domain-containing protein [Clostridia bacterium]